MATQISANEIGWKSGLVQTSGISSGTVWTGRILSGLPALFLVMDGVMKLFKPAPVLEATVRIGFPESSITVLGIVLLISTVLYVVPPTTVLGAILLTGYLGGAVATHVRVSDGWFSVLFPVVFGFLLWGGLWFRHSRVRKLLPLASA